MRISDWSSDVCSSDLSFRITLEHVLPNILSAIVVQATIQFALAILAEAALSYLGLGTQPPTPSWGRMLNEAQSYVFRAPLLAIWPGRSDEHTSELQSLMRISYAVFCLKKKKKHT